MFHSHLWRLHFPKLTLASFTDVKVHTPALGPMATDALGKEHYAVAPSRMVGVVLREVPVAKVADQDAVEETLFAVVHKREEIQEIVASRANNVVRAVLESLL